MPRPLFSTRGLLWLLRGSDGAPPKVSRVDVVVLLDGKLPLSKRAASSSLVTASAAQMLLIGTL
jgi:hypothetical protein